MVAAGLEPVRIVTATGDWISPWLELRAQLFEGVPKAQHLAEMDSIVRDGASNAAFLAFFSDAPVGLIEVSIRDSAEGCLTRGVGYVEGIFVVETVRRHGVAAALYLQAETWSRGKGAREMASDVRIGNAVSLAWHEGQGFEEVERVVLLRKPLAPEGDG